MFCKYNIYALILYMHDTRQFENNTISSISKIISLLLFILFLLIIVVIYHILIL
jgi:hypothetical protein